MLIYPFELTNLVLISPDTTEFVNTNDQLFSTNEKPYYQP